MPEEKIEKKEIKYEEKTSHGDDAKSTMEGVTDKMKAGAKAVTNKLKDTDKDTETEYRKEEFKEKM